MTLIVTDYAYSPRCRAFAETVAGRRLTATLDVATTTHLPFWLDAIARVMPDLLKIPREAPADDPVPRWINGMLPGLDGMLLYVLARELNPNTYLEVGSGNSTKFIRRAIQDGGLRTRIVSIDPEPRASIDGLCDEIIRAPLEDVGEAVCAQLVSGDLAFIDNSHRSFQNSDVTVFFTEILPAMPAGVTYGVHDIFLPFDYPDICREQFYNEQYLLASYLLGGAGGDDVVIPGIYASRTRSDEIARLFTHPLFETVEQHAGAFWMRRG